MMLERLLSAIRMSWDVSFLGKLYVCVMALGGILIALGLMQWVALDWEAQEIYRRKRNINIFNESPSDREFPGRELTPRILAAFGPSLYFILAGLLFVCAGLFPILRQAGR